MSVNVNRAVRDEFSRYRMPALLIKVEGKGNGIKTIVENLPGVAKSLDRPPLYILKYFSRILGAHVYHDQKNERYVVNGSHGLNLLESVLDSFIQKFVLCSTCKNPETVLLVHVKDSRITKDCKACGNAGLISAQEKLSAFILKHPPPQQPAARSLRKDTLNKDKSYKKNKKHGGSRASHDGELRQAIDDFYSCP